MTKPKHILVVGHPLQCATVAAELMARNIEVDIISPEKAKEINPPPPLEASLPYEITNLAQYDQLPPNRRERRARKRKKKNGTKK